MRENIKKYCQLIYFAMCAITIIMLIVGCSSYKEATDVKKYNKDTLSFREGWTDAFGNPVDMDNLQKLQGAVGDDYVSIFHPIPEQISDGSAFCFFARHIYYEVYINDEKIEDIYDPDSIVYNKSPGHRWNIIPVSAAEASGEIEIRIRCAYPKAQGSITDLYFGREAGIVMQIICEREYPLVMSILLLFFGVLLIIADVPMNTHNKKNHELLYLGWLAVWVAAWCISETHLIQLFTGNSRMANLLSCVSLFLVPLPVMLYTDEMATVKNKKVLYGICTFFIIEFVVCSVLHFTGRMDFKQNLTIAHISIVVSLLYSFCVIIRTIAKRNRKKTDIHDLLRIMGIVCFLITAVVDMVRYYFITGADGAKYVRVGLLIFVICYGCARFGEMLRAAKLGARSEVLGEVAYRDGLTGVWNRLWFQELLEELTENMDVLQAMNQTAGIAVFDINDLKQVNDEEGHIIGDKLIVAAAETIEKAFEGTDGECFRIGGDEFAVVMSGENLDAVFDDAFDRFDILVDEYNKDEKEFVLSVAKGWSILRDYEQGRGLQAVYNQADQAMYENKREMKEKK